MLQISISAAKVPKANKEQWDKMNTEEKALDEPISDKKLMLEDLQTR